MFKIGYGNEKEKYSGESASGDRCLQELFDQLWSSLPAIGCSVHTGANSIVLMPDIAELRSRIDISWRFSSNLHSEPAYLIKLHHISIQNIVKES
jgi:hypothetical protein